MIVYQPNFLFLGGLKACQFALSLLNKIHMTHIEQTSQKQEIRLIDNHEKDFYNEFMLIRSGEPK